MVVKINNTKFLPLDKTVGGSGRIELNNSSWCTDGNLYSSIYYGFKKIICTTYNTSYMNDVVHINPAPRKTVSFSPYRIFSDSKLVIASSKTEPLALYYTVRQDLITLFLYNFENFQEQEILNYQLLNSLSLSVINSKLRNCDINFAAVSSTTQNDIFLDCSTLGLQRTFLLHNDYKQKSYLLPNSLCNSSIKFGDFNGDKLSDILCLGTNPKIILNTDYFYIGNAQNNIITIDLQNSIYADWNQHFTNPNSLYLGDFDGDGLTDILSITDKPKILFGDISNVFISHNTNLNGKFTINALDNWCTDVSSDNLLITDYNNDNKDDILCKDDNIAYLMFSYSKPVTYGVSKIQVFIEDFQFSQENLSYDVVKKSVPYMCSTANIKDAHAYITCSFKNQIAVRNINLPIKPSSLYPYINISASVNGQIVITPEDNLIPKTIDSEYFIEYRRGQVVSRTTKDSDETHQFKIPAATCKVIEGEHALIKKKYTATVRVKVFGSDAETAKNSAIPQNLFNLQDFSFNSYGTEASFKINGDLEIDTIHSFVEKYCDQSANYKPANECVEELGCTDKIGIKRGFLSQAVDYPEKCPESDTSSPLYYKLSKPSIPNNIQLRLSAVQREDTLDMYGYVYNSTNFFPNEFVNSNATLTGHNTEHEDLQQSAIFYTNNYTVITAIYSNVSNCPRMTLETKFMYNNVAIKNITYAGFDSIRAVKMEPITESSLVMLWSLYFYQEHKFLIMLDYINNNVQNDFYRVSSYDGKFSTLAINSSLIFGYRLNQTHFEIIKLDKNVNSLHELRSITLNFSPENHLDFKLRNNDDQTFSLFWSYTNNKGIFFQRFDSNLNEIGEQKNIICFPNHFSVDTYGNNTVVVWQDLSQLSLDRHYFIQTITNNTFTFRKNIFNVNDTRVEDIEILNLKKSNTTSDMKFDIKNLGYLIFLKTNGTDHYTTIYNASLDLQQTFLQGDLPDYIEGLALTLDDLDKHPDLSDINNQISNDKVILSDHQENANSKISYLTNFITTGAALLSSSESCSCSCNVKERIEEVNSKAAEAEIKELEVVRSEEKVVAKSIAEKGAWFFSKVVEKLNIIKKGVVGKTAEQIEKILGENGVKSLKSFKDFLTKDIDVVGKKVPVIDIIFGAAFLVNEIVNIRSENGEVSTRTLRLNYQTDSKVDGANLDQINDLEQTLNFVYSGLTKTLPFIQNIDRVPNFRNFKNDITCNSVVSNDQIYDMVDRLKRILQGYLHVQFHTESDSSCNNNQNLYPAFRLGSELNLCYNYDKVDHDKACRIFLKILRDAGEFLLPFILTVSLANPILAFLATALLVLIVTVGIEALFSDEHIAELCHMFTCVTTEDPVSIVMDVITALEKDGNLKKIFNNEENEIKDIIANSDKEKIPEVFIKLVTNLISEGQVVSNLISNKFTEICSEHHHLEYSKLLTLSTTLITGLISQKQENIVNVTKCSDMSKRCCDQPDDQQDNLQCFSHLVVTTATTFDLADSFDYNIEETLEDLCSYGCALQEEESNALTTLIGGYYD